MTLAASAAAQQKVRVTGGVRDESNAITLPGIPVEVLGDGTVYTDVDFSYGINYFTTATGKSIPLSPLHGNDGLGFDRGVRALACHGDRMRVDAAVI